MDHEKIYVDQKTHVKIKLGYVKIKSLFVSKNIEKPKRNESSFKN
jgi:hypothetical protein